MLHAVAKPVQIEKQSGVWELFITLLTCGRTNTLGCPKRTAKILKHEKDCHEEDGACSWAKYKIIITCFIPMMRNGSPHNWLKMLTKPTDRERCEICWEHHPAGEKTVLYSDSEIRTAKRGPSVQQGIPGAVESQILRRISSRIKSSNKAVRKSSASWGLRKSRQPTCKEVWYQGAPEVTKENKQFTMDKNPNTQGLQRVFKPHHDAIFVVDMQGAQDEDLEFHQTSPTAASSASTRSARSTSEKVIHIQGHGRETRGFAARLQKISLMAAPWSKTKSTSIAQDIGKDTSPVRELSTRRPCTV